MSSDHERSADSATEAVVWVLFAGVLLLSTLAFIYPRAASSGVATDGGDSASADIGDADGEVDGATTDGDSDSERFTISASGDVLIHRRVAEAAARSSPRA